MTDDNRLGPPPVEPMSDVTWARVEKTLWSRIDSGATDAPPIASRPRWLWIAIPVVAVAAVLALILGTGQLRSNASNDQVPAIADSTEPSRVVAGEAPSAISFGDAHIDLAARSAIVMSREAGSPSVLLERGVATFAVAPRAGRLPFIVRAGDTVVRVVGTQFEVARYEERISVRVEHGLVDVQFRGTTRRLGAGQTWTSEEPGSIGTGTASATAESTPSTASTTPTTPRTQPTPPTMAPPADDAVATTALAATTDAPPQPTIETRPPKRTALAASPSTPGVEPPVPTAPSQHPTTTPAVRTTLPAQDADRERYDALVAIEQRDPETALAGYLALSSGHSRWSAVALYAAGRLAVDRKDRRAQTLLTIYLRRFENGANAEDARNLLARLKGEAP